MQQGSTLSPAEAGLKTRKKTVELLRSMLAKLSSGIEDLKDKEALEDCEIDRNTDNRLNELPNQRRLLGILESNLKDLWETVAVAARQTGGTNERRGYELKRILAASLEAKLKDSQEVETCSRSTTQMWV